MDTESTLMITPSEVIEHLYCPRFTYFMTCLNIPQHEEQRYKVLKGRELHERRSRENRDYLRKKIGCVSKAILVYLASPKIGVRGVVDEVLELSDGTMAPLDYKYTEFTEYIFKTHKYQSTIYGMLIEETYGKPVKRGYICYVKDGSTLKEINYNPSDFADARSLLSEVFDVILRGFYPKKTKFPIRCADCCYKNICV